MHGISLEVVRLPEAGKGFVPPPRPCRVVERLFVRATRFRRLAKDRERCAPTLADTHRVAFVCLMPGKSARLAATSLQPPAPGGLRPPGIAISRKHFGMHAGEG